MDLAAARARMVREQLACRGIRDERVLRAFARVPRHLFVPDDFQAQAYEDHPIPIGEGQTISQPYMVALMTEQLRLQGHERVLEIGAGSGYQTAILAELALEVFAIERLPTLLESAQRRLQRLGYSHVQFSAGNGSLGWPGNAPFDAILVAAAAPRVPPALVDQLAEGGRLVLPVGPSDAQMLLRIEKHQGALQREDIAHCAFVPLLGEAGWAEHD
jgi:protein-L-isoaspartate(D-aspartate) O-methyltransferase